MGDFPLTYHHQTLTVEKPVLPLCCLQFRLFLRTEYLPYRYMEPVWDPQQQTKLSTKWECQSLTLHMLTILGILFQSEQVLDIMSCVGFEAILSSQTSCASPFETLSSALNCLIHRLTSIHRLCIVSWRKGCSQRPCVASQSCSWDSSVAARQSFAFGNIESFVRFRLVPVTRNKRPPCWSWCVAIVLCPTCLFLRILLVVGLAWSCARPAGPWIIQPSTGVLRFLCETSAVRWNPQLWMWGGNAGNWQTNCCTCVADNNTSLKNCLRRPAEVADRTQVLKDMWCSTINQVKALLGCIMVIQSLLDFIIVTITLHLHLHHHHHHGVRVFVKLMWFSGVQPRHALAQVRRNGEIVRVQRIPWLPWWHKLSGTGNKAW